MIDRTKSATSTQRTRTLWLCLGLAAISVAVFWPIVHHDFVDLDDDVLIRDNPQFHPVKLEHILRYALLPHLGGVFPVTYAALGGVAALARGADGVIPPGPFHVTSLILHAVCAVVVFLILQRLLRGHDWAAAIGAALFAVHPVQVEVVAWATNINALLAAMFSLLAVYLYVLYAQAEEDATRRRALLYLAATASYALAMMSKPVAVTLPLVVAALDVLWIRHDIRKVVRPVAFWLVLAVPVALWTRHLLPAPKEVYSPVWLRPIEALDALAFYAGKVLLPIGTSVDYGRAPRWLANSSAMYVTWVVPAVIVLLLWWNRKRAAPLIAAAVVFVAPLLSVLGLTPFPSQRFSTVADRYLYVPMLGIAAAVAWGVTRFPRRAAMTVALVAWVIVLAAWSRFELTKWRDTETLFRVTVARNPTSVPGHSGLAFIARKRGEFDVAMAEYRAALAADPGYAPALYNVGNLLRAQGRPDQAITAYRSALVNNPSDPRVLSNLGVALAEVGQFQEADESFRAALQSYPEYIDALIGRGVVNRQLGRYDVSVEAYETALAIDPNAALARRGLEQTRSAMRAAATRPTTAGATK